MTRVAFWLMVERSKHDELRGVLERGQHGEVEKCGIY